MKRRMTMLTVVLAMTACSAGITAAERENVMVGLATDVFVPGYETFAVDTEDLAAATNLGCDSGDLSGASEAWSRASRSWLATSAYRLGPAGDRRTQNAISYPADADKVAEASVSVTRPSAVDELGSDARGLEAIGIVLTESGASACPYLIGAAERVARTARDLLDAWNGNNGYAANLATDMGSQDGIEMAINEIKTASDDLVFYRLASGLEEPSGPERATAVIASIASVYRGVEGAGLSALVESVSADTDTRVLALLDELQALPPSEALDPAMELRVLLATEVASGLSATLLLGDGDGDA